MTAVHLNMKAFSLALFVIKYHEPVDNSQVYTKNYKYPVNIFLSPKVQGLLKISGQNRIRPNGQIFFPVIGYVLLTKKHSTFIFRYEIILHLTTNPFTAIPWLGGSLTHREVFTFMFRSLHSYVIAIMGIFVTSLIWQSFIFTLSNLKNPY